MKTRLILVFLMALVGPLCHAQTAADSLIDRYKAMAGVRYMPMDKQLMQGLLSVAGENGVDEERVDSMRKSFEALDAMNTLMLQESGEGVRDSFVADFMRLPAHGGYRLIAHQPDDGSGSELWQQVLVDQGKVAEFLFLTRKGVFLNFVQLKTHMGVDDFRRLMERGMAAKP